MATKKNITVSDGKMLRQQIHQKTEALHSLRLDLALGKQKNVSQVRKEKRELARLQTKLNQLIIKSAQNI